MGYHDPPISMAPRPPLTTVRMPSRVRGRTAVERLVSILDGTLTGFRDGVVGDAPGFVPRSSLVAPT